jgi:PAS domain S-box-containing protein
MNLPSPDFADKAATAILIVEDEPAHAEAMLRSLQGAGWSNVEVVNSLGDFWRTSVARPPAIALVDFYLPDGHATELLLQPADEGLFPIIIMTSHGDQKTVKEVMKKGAFDYLVKSQEVFLDLPRFVTRTLREWELKHERIRLMNETQAIYDLSVDMICTIGLNEYFRRLNPSFQRILGFTSEELCSKPFIEFVHPDDRAATLAEFKLVLEVGQTISFRNRYHTKSGEYRWLEWSGMLAPRGDFVYCVARDVTDQIMRAKEAAELREQLSQATKMESIGHLTAGIAHDFNNMLGAIMGYSELSQHMIANGNIGAVSEYQQRILEAGNRAKELISQMLTFSRSSPDISAVDVPVISLNLIVKEVLTLLRASQPSTIELNCRIEKEDLSARIQAVHMHQILLNLGVNARDAAGKYGKIDISLSKANDAHGFCSSCKQSYRGDYAQVSVKDNGSGIEEQMLSKIFEPFFTSKDVGQGTGMGLSVVHGLVHAMDGHIRVDTGREKGTQFNILLPMVNTAVLSQAIVAATPLTNIKGIRVMVVDDEPALSHILQEFLADCGAEVVSFNNPLLAMETFMQQPDNIDLVISDENMPGMSGMLLAENMLKVKPSLAIILCTGYSGHANADAATKMGIGGFFTKPVNMAELMLKIQALVT